MKTTNYKFGWQSPTLKPIIIQVNGSIHIVGVDQNFVIFNYKSEEIIFKTTLDYFFYDVKIFGVHIFVITELEILKMNSKSFDIEERYALPDFFERFETKGETLEAHCMGNEVVIID